MRLWIVATETALIASACSPIAAFNDRLKIA